MKQLVLVTILVTSHLTMAVPLANEHPATVAMDTGDNEPPLADAGLDQSATLGRTVELDGRGSLDPDGTIESYQWTIQSPGGRTVTPACGSCAKTTFRANETGTFTVSLTVTDDDGSSSRDTLYVRVAGGSGPAISVTGPASVERGNATTVDATLHRGSAPLDRVEWYVDGSLAANHSVATAGRDSISPAFPSTGRHTVRAVLYDRQGRTSTDTVGINVVDPAASSGNNSTSTPPSTGGSGGSGDPTLASQYDPTVSGSKLVTGDQPLIADYSLASAPPAAVVDDITWFDAAGARGEDTSTRISWEPGDHQLFAVVTYTDGSNDVATFADGTTAVVADPAPRVGLINIDGENQVAGDLVTSDDYGNLMSVTVTVDDRTVFHEEGTRGGRNPTLGDSRSSWFSFEDIEPNRTYTVTLTAVDGRGQRSTTDREVTAVGEIEIVSAGFVNGPVDSHHSRIDPDRYTAHHIVEVDLNGHDAEDVSMSYSFSSPLIKQLSKNSRVEQHWTGNTRVVFESNWSGYVPDSHHIRYDINGAGGSGAHPKLSSTFVVEPSNPELRLTTETHGTEPIGQQWGIIVDATESFDPDHTQLEYDWLGGAEHVPGNPGIGRFRSRESGGLVVSDQNRGRVGKNWSFLDHFVPGIESIEKTNSGPFNATDTVRFHVASEPWAFTKTREEYRVDLDFVTESRHVDIVSQGQVTVPQSEVPQHDTTDRLQRQVATIEVPAAALAAGRTPPEIVLQNTANPERSRSSTRLPALDIELNVTNATLYENLTVESIAYRVERDNVTLNESVDDGLELRRYLSQGYEIADTREVTTGIKLERYEEVRVRKTSRKSFGSASNRRRFLRIHPDWVDTGREVETRQESVTRTEWRRSKSGDGTFTGETKEETVPAQKRTVKQFEYEVQKTRTVDVEVEKTVEVTKQVEIEVEEERCNPIVGCYIHTVTKTVERTVTETRTVTVERERNYWDTERYWGRTAHSPQHTFTGKTKKITVRPSYDRTLYEFAITEIETVRETTYFASNHHVVTEKAWVPYTTVSDPREAAKAVRQRNIRANGSTTETRWTVSKQGTAVRTVAEFEDEEDVVETIAIVSGTEKKKEFIHSLGEERIIQTKEFRKEFRQDGAFSVGGIVRRFTDGGNSCNSTGECTE
ncbi:PKD domain-containing protein [Haloarchaeobius amylolyticus]|uniref:PKD domain-containing protein n=1 Tax=Haloarchaeobius amylolyticus TaxID=1198296 RepID=UPI00226EB63B|nr:PKD domain-containing protein [Haloarchaeobius amylolyticus]